MTDNELGATVFVIILVGFYGFLVIGGLICWKIEVYKQKKYKKLYPEVFNLIDKLNKLQDEFCKWHNKNITPLRNELEYRLNQLKYLPKNKLKEEEKELEELKEKLYQLEIKHKEQYEEEKKIREQIKTQASKDEKFKKYMTNLGWFREE